MHTISPQNAGRARVCVRIRIYSNIPRVPWRLLICIPAHLRICTSASTKRANFPARLRAGKSALLPASGHKRSCPPPESAKLRDFFCTPQRAGIQRVTSVSREISENFSKISSPKIWCVCQKSVPLHSQNRNEAYNTSQI
jgi:hypothetical protein